MFDRPSGKPRHASIFIASAISIAALFAFIPKVHAESDSGGGMAESLVELRSEVDALASELERKKQEYADELRSLGRQKADLESQLSRERFRLKQLQAAIARETERLATGNVDEDLLKPVVLDAIDEMQRYVQESLPFQTVQRMDALTTLRNQTQSGALAPGKTLARLWAFAEDEFRLTRESGLYRQPVVLEGEEVLADVARIGMVAMFVTTADNRMGMSKKTPNGWVFVSISDPENRERIEALFGAFKKQLRTGFFTIPNPLPASVQDSKEVTP